MIARIKKVFKNWRADRQHLRELTIKLDALTDHHFFVRAAYYEDKLTVGEIMRYKWMGIL